MRINYNLDNNTKHCLRTNETERPRWGWSIKCKNCGWKNLCGGIQTKKQLDDIIREVRSQNHGCDNPNFEEKIRVADLDLTDDLPNLVVEEKLDKIIHMFNKKEEKEDEFRNKLTFILSSLHQSDNLNKDTFNRLDEMLRDYLDSSI